MCRRRYGWPPIAVWLAAATCFFVLSGRLRAASAGRPFRSEPLLGEIVLDGSMADPIWRDMTPLTGFVKLPGGKPAEAETEVRVCHDETTLYILATCREPDVTKIRAGVTEHDADLSADDRVTLRFDGASGETYELTGSAGGALYDALVSGEGKADPRWESDAKCAVQVFKKAWGIEFAVPLIKIGLKPTVGPTVVRLRVRRHRVAAQEVSCLRATRGPNANVVEARQAIVFVPPPEEAEPVAAVRPRAGIRYSAADIENARANVKRFPWAKRVARSVIKKADAYLEKPAAYYLSFMPPKGATFAYGFAGCPKCGAGWPRFGRGMCSFERPGKVRCRKCHALFPADDPKDPFYDPGDGVIIKGHRYYFKGVWHAWVILQYKAMLDKLSIAYALTGDERYAERAALIFDAMATLAPSTVGPRDNMRPHQKKVGIFHYYTQQLTEHLRAYLLDYDLLYYSKAIARVSPTNPTAFGKTKGYTIRQNIEKNLFLDTWDVEMNTRNGRLRNLHNHTSATVRAMMGVGLVCGKPDLIRWGIEASYKFIRNTIDPEGQYYETSGQGYNECGRQCNASFADMLWNYDPNNYQEPSRFPQPKDYPYEIKLYRIPRMRVHLDRALYEMDCAGHRPRYGDSGPDVRVITDPVGEWRHIRRRWAFALYRSATDEAERRRYFRKMQAAGGGKVENSFGIDELFWFKPLRAPLSYDPGQTFNLTRSSLWGQRATAILRQGEGRDRMALLMLGGTIFPHGNDDTLHISLYSRGQLLTHEVAYDLYGRPVHYGWGTRSIAHCTVTVDERGAPPLYRGGPNANVQGFADLGVLSFTAMAAGPQCWKGQPAIKQYDRACALVDLPGEGGYFVDLFDVRGGRRHDYSFHGQITKRGEGFRLEGASLRPQKNVWTLAGLSGFADASFDAPGRSWGERVAPGNRIRDLGIPGEKIGYFGWIPPPGNGYGFLFDVKVGPSSGKIQADWTTHAPSDIHLRLTLFPGANTRILTAKGPDLSGRSVIPFVIARRDGEDLASSFLAAMEGYQKRPRLLSVEQLPTAHGMRGLRVTAQGGVEDRIWLDTRGGLAHVRKEKGKVTWLALYQTSEVRQDGIELKLSTPALVGRVKTAEYEAHSLRTDLTPGNPSALCGRTLFVSSPDYTHNSAYRIETCNVDGTFGFGPVGFDLAMADYSGRVRGGIVVSSTPMTLTRTGGRPKQTGLLDGKLARTPDGRRSGVVGSFVDYAKLRFRPGCTIAQGDTFVIYDVKPGDGVRVPMCATLHRSAGGDWELFATCDVTVRMPGKRTLYRAADGTWVTPATSRGGRAVIPVSGIAKGYTILRVR
ncbi:MAG: hypothetical protein GXP31_02600 [Kiritimatiellaeota bacterium]|nr:hypothetical protein [Kiritimatiellota bacterium]